MRRISAEYYVKRRKQSLRPFRRVATRYGKTARDFLSAVCLAINRFLLRRIADQSIEFTA